MTTNTASGAERCLLHVLGEKGKSECVSDVIVLDWGFQSESHGAGWGGEGVLLFAPV